MKSPLKAKPLRNPGESLDNQIQEVIFDEAGPLILIPVMLIVMAGIEWFRWYMETPPTPIVYTIAAIGAVFYSGFKIRKIKARVRALKLGRDGEKAVGQYLESLRASGSQVFHDIQGDQFNLDHVAIDESGVYVIETKTYSKPDSGHAKIIFKGESIIKGGGYETDKPIIQVRAAANWLAQVLEESTGKKLSVKPVIVFPGWYVEPTYEAKNSDVWVLNPKALPAFIKNSKKQYAPEDVKLFAYHLSRHIRSKH
jgi:hypothetical protein